MQRVVALEGEVEASRSSSSAAPLDEFGRIRRTRPAERIDRNQPRHTVTSRMRRLSVRRIGDQALMTRANINRG